MMFGNDEYHQFATVCEVEPRSFVLHVFGDVDLSSADALIAAIDEIVTTDHTATLRINVTKCRYFDSSGLAALMHAHGVFGTRLSIIVTARSQVLRTLRLVGFDKILTIVTELHPYDATAGRSLVAVAGATR